jgi:autotransporter strand-loop-strand O-heptosyltransferase
VVGLHRQAAYILGVDPAEALPRVTVAQAPRLIADRYVCIAVQSSSLTKYRHYPNGWAEIVEFLRNAGYRVLCIDKEAEYGTADIRVKMPAAAEDWTGDRPLPERAHVLQHADFFVGLASGLAWLAWAVGTPVVMISGFSHPDTEFFTPYRVFNASVCNGCWNDLAYTFPLDNPLWCPRHAGTQRHFECSKAITVEDVKAAIRRIPAFGSISK